MTQEEALIRALQQLGGKAKLEEIYPLAIKQLGKEGANTKASFRKTLQKHPVSFKSHQRGIWELASYQTEIAELNQRIKELEEENEILRAVKTEDDFVRRLVEETKNLYKYEKDKMKVIWQILHTLGRRDAEAIIDACLKDKDNQSSLNVNFNHYDNKNTNIETNYGTNVDVHDGGTVSLPNKIIKQ